MRTRKRPTALCAGALALIMVASVGASALAADPPPEPTYRFTGYGTDHGVGLSQRGAAGRAKAGQDYVTILRHYFDGVHVDTVPTDTTIRALVVKAYKPIDAQTPLVMGGKGGPGNTQLSRWTFDTPGVHRQVFPYSWRLVLIGTGAKGAWHLEVQDAHGDTKLSVTDDDARLTVSSVAKDADPGRIQVLIKPGIKNDTYQGSLRIGRMNGQIRVVNIVAIEPFVRSVTPQEVGPANLPDTLKSQAVVARSYFLAGRSSSTAWLAFDVQSYRGTESYQGTKGENAKVTESVDATAYQVVMFHSTIARTFYHAVGGGATEASWNVFTGDDGHPGAKLPYLKGSPDVDANGVPYDATAPAYSWSSRAFTLEQLSDILRHDSRTNVGKLDRWPIESERTYRAKRASSIAADPGDITPTPPNRGVSGRLTWVVLVGTRHGKTVTKKVAGWLFKSVFNAHRGSGDPLGSTMIFRTRVD